jgi:hypothetical protein
MTYMTKAFICIFHSVVTVNPLQLFFILNAFLPHDNYGLANKVAVLIKMKGLLFFDN